MNTTPRSILRGILADLSKRTINKHKPEIICIVGSGETSIIREDLYENIHGKYPARRNVEIPELEFSLPLTIIGILRYPANPLDWVILLCASYLKLLLTKPFKHYLILEMPEITPKITEYWMRIINPKYIVVTEDLKDLRIMGKSNIIKNMDELYQKLGVKPKHPTLPEPRIKVLAGLNNSVIIDATHLYTPAPLKTVLEVGCKGEKRIYLFTNLPKDIELAKKLPKIILNKSDLKPEKGDVIIIRGNKNEQTKLLERFINYFRT